MDGPSDALRGGVLTMVADIDAVDERAEQSLRAALSDIEGDLSRDVARADLELHDEDAAMDQLAAIDAWTALISSAVARIYAPASPWHRQVAGWAKRISAQLRWLTNLLLAPLRAAAGALGAVSYSISISFPWGVSVGLDWS